MWPEALNLKKLIMLRNTIWEIINTLDANCGSREISLSKTKLEEARMWLGKQMANVGWEDLNKARDEELNKSD